MKTKAISLCGALAILLDVAGAPVTIYPREYDGPVRNPFKGIESRVPLPLSAHSHTNEWFKLGSVINVRDVFHWSQIESRETDTKEKIARRVNDLLEGFDRYNCHARFRVMPFTGANGTTSLLPDDLPEHDYTNQTAYFQQRAAGLIRKLGEVLDGDPRVALVEIGLIGKWGEQHNPTPSHATQEVMGQAYREHFQRTLVYNRNHHQFTNFNFGYYNDAAMESGGAGGYMEKTLTSKHPDRWKTYPLEGEVRAFVGSLRGTNWNDFRAILQDDEKTRWAINNIRWCHYAHCCLLWLSWNQFPGWDRLTDRERRNLFAIHKAFGYRLVIPEFKYDSSVLPGESFTVSFKVINMGAAPMYYNWPVEISLLDPVSKMPVCKETFTGLDIRTWIGGEGFSVEPGPDHVNFRSALHAYTTPAPVHAVEQTFRLPAATPDGVYILALAVLNPQGNPALRFAISNYFNGGRHPMGYVGVNRAPAQTEIAPREFDDLFEDPRCIPDNRKKIPIQTSGN